MHITNYLTQPNKMMANISEPFKNKPYNFKPCQTPLKQHKKDCARTRSHQSFIKEHQQKVSMMLDMNRLYEQEVVNSQIYKIRQLEKYSPKRILRNQKQKSFQNLSPIKLHKLSSSKEKVSTKKSSQQLLNKTQGQQNFTLFGRKFTQKRIVQNQSSLPELPENQIRVSKLVEDSWMDNSDQPLTGYWIPHNQIVSLYPVNNRKIDKVPVINQPYILPMLGCLTIKNDKKTQKFIVTELYQNNTLRDILSQFQNLSQVCVKNYLRKIILCVWNLHKNRIAHNRLTLDAFILTENGDLLLNMLKSSTKPLSQKQRFQHTYYFPPQMLLSRTNYDSMKNDIWAIGCIALQLLTNYDPKNNPYHPYNQSVQQQNAQSPPKINTVQISKKDKFLRFMTSFEASRMSQINIMKDSMNILQKVKRLIQADNTPTVFHQSLINIQLCQSIILKQISPLAADFAKRCLNLRLQKRPSIDELMFHSFLK